MARQDHFPAPAFVILIKRNLIHRLLAEENKKVSREDSLRALAQENQHLGQPLEDNGLLQGQPCPVFEQASKAAAEFLEIPIAVVGWVGSKSDMAFGG